jgi:hypothetical protein
MPNLVDFMPFSFSSLSGGFFPRCCLSFVEKPQRMSCMHAALVGGAISPKASLMSSPKNRAFPARSRFHRSIHRSESIFCSNSLLLNFSRFIKYFDRLRRILIDRYGSVFGAPLNRLNNFSVVPFWSARKKKLFARLQVASERASGCQEACARGRVRLN